MALQVVGPDWTGTGPGRATIPTVDGKDSGHARCSARALSSKRFFTVARSRAISASKGMKTGQLVGVLCTLLLVGVVLATGELVIDKHVTFARAGGGT